MNYEQHLKLLQVTKYSTLDEIKSSYRKLAKVYHPDINKSDGKLFLLLNQSYEWLIKNHKPVKPPKDTGDYDKYYRVLDKVTHHGITLPVKEVLERGIVINCMIGMREFRIILEKGEVLPKTIKITNITKEPLIVAIHCSLDMSI